MFKNIHIKILALFCAIIFWAVIVTTENTYFVVPEKITPQVFNVDEGLAIADELTPVAVTVRTSSDVFRQLTPGDFKVYVDAQDLSEGEHTLDVLVSTKKADVSIVSIEPAQIALKIEKMAKQVEKISLTITGTPAKSYAVGEVEPLTPTVEVTGAENLVSKLAAVTGVVQLQSTETTNFVSHITLQAEDGQGNILPLTLDPVEVDVIVPVLQVVQSKTVGVKANVQNTLENSFIESIAVEPDVVSITGEAGILENITYIETKPITPQQVGINITNGILALPDGVTLVENESPQVRITIIISPLETDITTTNL